MARSSKPRSKPKSKSKENWLVFVDTNILLDFYRVGGERADRQLKALEKHKGSLITSDQVWMEFLKNRQQVIVLSIKEIQKPNRASVPPIVANYKPAKMLAKHLENATKKHSNVKARIEKILRDPVRHDPVYQSLNRIFEGEAPFNLKRPNKARYEVRRLARKRFVLGYPPRKSSDTSIGDAINWEWVIHCAINSDKNNHILIVSRDSDYGATYGSDAVLNDWLRREFKERVSQKRKIELTTRLTVALKRLDERVTEADETAEQELLNEWKSGLAQAIRNLETQDLRSFYDAVLEARASRDTFKKTAVSTGDPQPAG